MRRLDLILILFASALVYACQSTNLDLNGNESVLQDSLFPDYGEVPIETEEEVFALNEEARKFAKSSIKGVFEPEERIQALVKHIFTHSNFNLLYRAEANTTAIQTFQNKAANCLSMSIMTYALAKELGFGVRFQDIEIPEYWTRREGHSLLNRHINLQILPKPNRNKIRYMTHGFEVDFDAQASRPHFPKTLLTINQVLAMFYNNKGADALLNKRYKTAYAYFKNALIQSPDMASALANLGYLYRLTGHYKHAEKTYYQALKYDEDNLTAWRNLAYLYEFTGQDQKADDIAKRVRRKRDDNPFFHINLGDKAFEKKKWSDALGHYQKALKLDKSRHEVFFGLGKTYFALGNLSRSKHYLTLAKKKSRTEQEQETYQGKLDLVKKMNSQRSSS